MHDSLADICLGLGTSRLVTRLEKLRKLKIGWGKAGMWKKWGKSGRCVVAGGRVVLRNQKQLFQFSGMRQNVSIVCRDLLKNVAVLVMMRT